MLQGEVGNVLLITHWRLFLPGSLPFTAVVPVKKASGRMRHIIDLSPLSTVELTNFKVKTVIAVLVSIKKGDLHISKSQIIYTLITTHGMEPPGTATLEEIP